MEMSGNINKTYLYSEEESHSESNVKRWQEYQTLIKEEIILNEIVHKHQENSIENLKNHFVEYYKSKLMIKETCDFNSKILGISHTVNPNNIELVENSEKELLEVIEPVTKFLFQLRNNEKHVFNVIQNVKKSDEMEELVNLISHFFYENILIQNPEQEEIIYICYMLIEKEIDSLNSPSVASFLDRSFIGKLLKSLTRRQDIKAYLSMVLGDLILKMENSTENFLEVDPMRIYDHIKNKKTTETFNNSFNLEKSKKIFEMDRKLMLGDRLRKTTIARKSTIENSVTTHLDLDSTEISQHTSHTSSSFHIKSSMLNESNDKSSINKSGHSQNEGHDILNYDEFFDRGVNENDVNNDYLIDLTEEELQFRFEKEENPEMKEFYFKQLNRIDDDKGMYTNQKFLEHLSVYSSESYKVLYIYKKNFEKIKFFIDQLFTNIIENDSVIPYIIRCISKIINELIIQKFPKIGFHEKNAFIGEFIFGRLIMPILTNPDYNGIISSSVISLNTRKNLCNINQILKKISRASLFDSTREMNFTIFNTYLLEIMPIISNFFKKIDKVKLPKRIEEILKNRCNIQHFNYFTENPDQLVNLQSICFSIQDLQIILKTVKNNIDLFSGDCLLKKSLEKIEYQEGYLNAKVKESSGMGIKKYFLIFNKIFNPNKVEILLPKQYRFTFTEEEVDHEFTLVRIKYCIKTILRSLNIINSRVYSQLQEADTSEKFFQGLNKIISLEDYSDNLTGDKIPLSWYSLYLNTNLSQLKDEYIDDNYRKLYEELIVEVKKEIEMLNFKSNLMITKYGLNSACAEKKSEVWRKDMLKVKQIEKFIRVEKFIETAKVSVCVRNTREGKDLNNSGEDKPASINICKPDQCVHRFHFIHRAVEGKVQKKSIFSKDNGLSSSGHNKSHSMTESNKPEGHCETVTEFIQTFQNFNEIKEDVILGDKRNKIYESVDSYLSIVKEVMVTHSLFYNIYNEENINSALEDIENYILTKLHKKVFPEKEIDKDFLFFEQCCKLEWITPTHLEINKKFINEKLWESAISNLNRMNYQRSPLDKLKCVQCAYKILNNCINFSSGKEENAGVDDIIPILIYIIIKSKPHRIFSNIQYIKTFMNPSKLLATYGFLLTQIEMATEFIFGISHKVLKISEEEFKKNVEDYSFTRVRANSRVLKKAK